MSYKYNKKLILNAQQLRKNMTDEENHLWYDFLKKLPVTVKRQQSIGNYIVDFYIAKPQTVIEIDGKQHGFIENIEADRIRNAYLFDLGINVLRYKNVDINTRFYAVCRDILNHIGLTENDVDI